MNDKLKSVLHLYQNSYQFVHFYQTLLASDRKGANSYIHERFLNGYIPEEELLPIISAPVSVRETDIRVDLPIWFGTYEAKHKIVVLGMEPRATHDKYHIERAGKYVFGTPFAIEAWRGKYFNVFNSLYLKEDTFIYFTDVVKEYDVLEWGSKDARRKNDLNARNTFNAKQKYYQEFLNEEIALISPTLILCLGNDSHGVVLRCFGQKYENSIKKVIHPAAWGGVKKANEQIYCLLSEL